MTDIVASAELMDRIYRRQRHLYDFTRKYYLLGRDRLIHRLSPPAGSRVLEIGCGTARNLVVAATGTGKTVSLQVMAEGFARAGVPVFAADIKGDLSGISEMGEAKDFILKRIQGFFTLPLSQRLRRWPILVVSVVFDMALLVRASQLMRRGAGAGASATRAAQIAVRSGTGSPR